MPAEFAYNKLGDRQPRWKHASTLQSSLAVLQYAYQVFVLVFFLVAFTVRSIAASKTDSTVAKPTATGHGGKPLPATNPTRNFVKDTVHNDITQI